MVIAWIRVGTTSRIWNPLRGLNCQPRWCGTFFDRRGPRQHFVVDSPGVVHDGQKTFHMRRNREMERGKEQGVTVRDFLDG